MFIAYSINTTTGGGVYTVSDKHLRHGGSGYETIGQYTIDRRDVNRKRPWTTDMRIDATVRCMHGETRLNSSLAYGHSH